VSVRIKGYQIPRGINAVWRATVLTADTVQLNHWIAPTNPNVVAFGKNPTIRKQVYTYVSITGARIVRATSHYTGKPTELLGGRRRTRRTSLAGQPVAV
jgi:hypothetical protein